MALDWSRFIRAVVEDSFIFFLYIFIFILFLLPSSCQVILSSIMSVCLFRLYYLLFSFFFFSVSTFISISIFFFILNSFCITEQTGRRGKKKERKEKKTLNDLI